MKKIKVKLGKSSYDISIASGLLRHAGREVRRVLPGPESRVFVVTSPKVRKCWGAELEQSLKKAKLRYEVLEMNDGEPAKRLVTVEQLAEKMVEAHADRQSVVVAFGGGVVGDSAGFLASIFMRGIPVVQIPTTVQAQLDASIGGKTGVNLRSGKNLIGTFHQPRAVIVDPDVLETLDEREFRAGMFEALKCGVIRDSKLFDLMERNSQKGRSRKLTEKIILASAQVKAAVVASDERESGLRRILNYGHTIGHALESATNYTHFLHGEAVAWGMIAAASIARGAGLCSAETAKRIQAAVLAYGELPPVTVTANDVLARLGADKKTIAGAVHYVLPVKVGKVTITSKVPLDIVRAAVDEIRNHV
ncbi:MAG TPA: 3-dehydroquinate synthase [Candidatus Angelobacter sp.]|nr:3-dehydroquinate synthase [Candidatus Angelobacter sp.]